MRAGRLIVVAMLSSACGVELETPDTLEVRCASDADCLPGLVCAPLLGRCVVTIDVDAPRMLNADTPAEDRVRVVYSEPVSCGTVAEAAAYAITPSLAVTLATGVGCDGPSALTSEALLFTDLQVPGKPYVLVASGIADGGGNALADGFDSASFTGFGQPPDATPPVALSPANHARVLGTAQGIVWTSRPGASTYVVEVALEPAFATQIPGSPFTVSAPATTLSLVDLQDVTYFWRIRSDLTDPDEVLPVYDFDVLVDTVYVACAGTGPCSDAGLHNGSRTRPYASVGRALAAAAEMSTTLRLQNVAIKIAARGPSAVYEGPVVVQWQSISMSGGWDATFTTRDVNPDVTVIEGTGAVMVIGNLPVPISGRIEGLTLRSTGLAPTTPTLSVNTASSLLTLRDIKVQGHASPFGGLVQVSGGPPAGPRFDRCTFVVDAEIDGDANGVVVSNAAPTFTSSQFVFGATAGCGTAHALTVRGPLPGDLIVEDGTLLAADAREESHGLHAEVGATSAGDIILRRTLVVGGSSKVSEALDLQGAPRLVVEDSRLTAGPALIRCHVVGEDVGGRTTFRNSVLQTTGGLTESCETVEVENSASVEIINSVVISNEAGVPPLLFLDGHSVVTNSIIVVRSSGTTCVDQPWRDSPTRGTPAAFQNNVLANCTDAYRIFNAEPPNPPPPTIATSSTELDAFSGIPLRDGTCNDAGCPQARFAGNVVLPGSTLTTIFMDADGPDNDPATMGDNDFHLRGDADLAIRQGGLAAGSTTCAPIGESASCNIPTLDSDGDARSAPFSIGPDEAP